MTTPGGGSPEGWPDAMRGGPSAPDPSVTSWAPMPQEPPPWSGPPPPGGYPYPGPPTGAYPGQPSSGGWPQPGSGGWPQPGYGQQGTQWTQQGWGPAPPQPPRPDRGRFIALALIGAIVLAGLGVGTFLLVRTAAPGGGSPAGFRTVQTSALTFAVPPDWPAGTNPVPPTILGATFEGVTNGPAYDCGGAPYVRGIVSSTFVEGDRPPAAVATAFGREIGRLYYTIDDVAPDVRLSGGLPVEVDGVEGQLVEATVRAPADDGCLATTGVVLLLAVPTAGPGGAPGTALLVVNGDTAGGPAGAPPVPDRATLDAIVGSAELPGP